MRWASAPGQPPAPYVPPPAPPKQGSGCVRVVMVGLVGGFALCCCLMSAIADSAKDPLEWTDLTTPERDLPGPKTALGVALVPDTLPLTSARHYAWRARRKAWELSYGVSTEVHQQVETDFHELADEFSYIPGRGERFTWAPPLRCNQREWECVFDALARDNADDIAPLTELFRRKQRNDKLDARQVTELVVSFVQNIRYRLPTEPSAAFGLLPPTIVVADGSGDCDSKALLAVIVLRQLGVDAVVLLASNLGHAALGVALPVAGRKFKKKYAFVEVTTPGWALGAMPPEYDVANQWKVIPVKVP